MITKLSITESKQQGCRIIPKGHVDFYKKFIFLWAVDITRLRYENETIQKYEQREPGYVKALLKAYHYGFTQKKTRGLNEEFVLDLHAAAISHLNELNGGKYKQATNNFFIFDNSIKAVCNPSATKKGLWEFIERWIINDRRSVHTIGITPKKVGELGYLIFRNKEKILFFTMKGQDKAKPAEEFKPDGVHRALLEKCLSDPLSYQFSINAIDDDLVTLHGYPDFTTAIQEKLQEIYDSYNAAIAKASTNDEKLLIIHKHAQYINQLHPFDDGNVRVCDVLIKALEHEEGLPLSLRLDPNRLDGFSSRELFELAKQGQQDFLMFCEGKIPVYKDPYFSEKNHCLFPILPQEIPGVEEEIDGFINDVLQGYYIKTCFPPEVCKQFDAMLVKHYSTAPSAIDAMRLVP